MFNLKKRKMAKRKTISFRLTEKLHVAIEAMAKSEQVSVSEMIHILLQEGVKNG